MFRRRRGRQKKGIVWVWRSTGMCVTSRGGSCVGCRFRGLARCMCCVCRQGGHGGVACPGLVSALLRL
eukprot:347896-Chlamydomonas_euryale.AAC.1